MAASTTLSDCEIDFRSRQPRERSMAEQSTAVWIAECNGLTFNGFAYDTHTSSICDNMQTIRLLDSGEVCTLGAFTKLPPAPHSKI